MASAVAGPCSNGVSFIHTYRELLRLRALQHEAAALRFGHRRDECGARALRKPGEADDCCHGGHVRTLWPSLLNTDAGGQGYASCLSQ